MKTTESDAVAALVGHYGPGARSVLSTAEDVGKTDTLKAMGRHQRAVERRAISGGVFLRMNEHGSLFRNTCLVWVRRRHTT